MRSILTMTTVAACGLMLTGCATTGYGDYASACERDYARNRELATGAGAALGAAVGAAVAGEGNREEGAAIGAIAGALIGRELSEEEDPCGYGFGGYNRDYRYGRERVYRREVERAARIHREWRPPGESVLAAPTRRRSLGTSAVLWR